jgi:hypothetical protein
MKKFILARQSDGFIQMLSNAPSIDSLPVIEGFIPIEVTEDPPGELTEFKWNWEAEDYSSLPKRPSPRHEFESGRWVDKDPPPAAPPLTVEQARLTMYPSVQNQLDMLWHAMDDGQLPKAEPFYSTLKFVKETNPKPLEEKVWPVARND